MAMFGIDELVHLDELDDRPLASLICGSVFDQERAAAVLATDDGLIHVIASDSDTRTFALITVDGKPRQTPIIMIRVFDNDLFLLEKSSNRILQTALSSQGIVKQIRFSDAAIWTFDIGRDACLVVGDAQGHLFVWDYYLNNCVWLFDFGNDPIAAIAIESSKHIATIATMSGHIAVADLSSQALSKPIQADLKTTVSCAWFGHSGAAIADFNGRILIVEMVEGRLETTQNWTEQATVISIAVNVSGDYIAVGLRNGHVIVRSLQEPSVILGQHMVTSTVIALEFISSFDKGLRLLVASHRGDIELWPIDVGHDEPFDVSYPETVEKSPSTSPTPDIHYNEVESCRSEDSEQAISAIETESPIGLHEKNAAAAGDMMMPRSGPAPSPEPPIPSSDAATNCKMPSLPCPVEFPLVGLNDQRTTDIHSVTYQCPEARQSSAAPEPFQTPELPAILRSQPIDHFSSEDRIQGLLNRPINLSSDSVLATPSLNSTEWIRRRINELTTNALTETPDIDVSIVRERAASKASHVDRKRTDVFGDLPSITGDLPSPPKIQIQKQVDPRWIRSLDRKPNIEASLNRDDLEPQVPGYDLNWSPASSGHERASTQSVDVAVQMRSIIQQRIAYWKQTNALPPQAHSL